MRTRALALLESGINRRDLGAFGGEFILRSDGNFLKLGASPLLLAREHHDPDGLSLPDNYMINRVARLLQVHHSDDSISDLLIDLQLRRLLKTPARLAQLFVEESFLFAVPAPPRANSAHMALRHSGAAFLARLAAMTQAFDSWKVLAHEPIVELADNLWWVRGSLPGMSLKRTMTVLRLGERQGRTNLRIAPSTK